ncbi:hypothetical protein ACQKEY_07125 [Lysinibacillus fusiformis]|uniref:hypothetical protein n=1 Tax=Lysinibacillus fusiformis TaxID=28031 RepID=UPI003D0051B0
MLNSLKLNKLYEEIYEPKLLPQDLLNNLSLKNYISVDFSKKDNFLQAVTKCYLANGQISTYVYTFNDLKLIKLVEKNSADQSTILYDRQVEINKLKKELISEENFTFVS